MIYYSTDNIKLYIKVQTKMDYTLKAYVDKTNGDYLSYLPLIHTCDGFSFRKILASGKLKKTTCPVFEEDLLYFFYGKPSYRTTRDNQASSQMSHFPISFVLDIEKCNSSPHKIFPFDSGAFNHGMFKDYFHEETTFENISLNPKTETSRNFIASFYDCNEDYLQTRLKGNLSVTPLAYEVEGYVSLVSSSKKTPFDDRSSTLEISYSQDIPLSPENILYIVVPSVYLDDPYVRKTLEDDWKVKIGTYTIFHGNPNEYVSIVKERVNNFIETHSRGGITT